MHGSTPAHGLFILDARVGLRVVRRGGDVHKINPPPSGIPLMEEVDLLSVIEGVIIDE